MQPTKKELIERNGLRCMLCGREFDYCQINWHHIKPKAVCRHYNEKVDNSYANGSLLCLDCHAYVHTLYYWSNEYQNAMRIVKSNKK